MSVSFFNKHLIGRRIVSFFALAAFLLTSGIAPAGYAYAQELFQLPQPGTRINSSPAFAPALLRGFKVDSANPLAFDFIVDKGDTHLDGRSLQEEGRKLIKYFLTALTVPSRDLWVNLSPYENDRIIPEKFGLTEMGRDLLAQDYILKQLTASLMYPESRLGVNFWKRVYARARAEFGSTDIPIDTFNKVWIMPDKARVYEKGNSVYLVEAKMKVLLEQDYLAQENNKAGVDRLASSDDRHKTSKFATDILREIIIPELTREVNEGKNFAQLRQVHYSLVLAAWYEKRIKDSIMGRTFSSQNKIAGSEADDPQAKEKIYAQYVEAFKKGAYNFIKEDVDAYSSEIVSRKYFSGGVVEDKEMVVKESESVETPPFVDPGQSVAINAIVGPSNPAAVVDSAQMFPSNVPTQSGLHDFDHLLPAQQNELRTIVIKAQDVTSDFESQVGKASAVLHSVAGGAAQICSIRVMKVSGLVQKISCGSPTKDSLS